MISSVPVASIFFFPLKNIDLKIAKSSVCLLVKIHSESVLQN